MAVFNQPGNQIDDLRNMICRFRMYGRRPDAQRLSVLVILRDKPVCQFLYSDAFLIGTPDHLVINIREVLDEGHIIAFPFQLPPQYVKGDERTCVSDMKIVVHSRTAGINPRLPFLYRFEFFLFPGQAVVYVHVIISPSFLRSCSR